MTNEDRRRGHPNAARGLGPLGFEPRTNGLKVRCSDDRRASAPQQGAPWQGDPRTASQKVRSPLSSRGRLRALRLIGSLGSASDAIFMPHSHRNDAATRWTGRGQPRLATPGGRDPRSGRRLLPQAAKPPSHLQDWTLDARPLRSLCIVAGVIRAGRGGTAHGQAANRSCTSSRSPAV